VEWLCTDFAIRQTVSSIKPADASFDGGQKFLLDF
jgi:hypothetical protein